MKVKKRKTFWTGGNMRTSVPDLTNDTISQKILRLQTPNVLVLVGIDLYLTGLLKVCPILSWHRGCRELTVLCSQLPGHYEGQRDEAWGCKDPSHTGLIIIHTTSQLYIEILTSDLQQFFFAKIKDDQINFCRLVKQSQQHLRFTIGLFITWGRFLVPLVTELKFIKLLLQRARNEETSRSKTM